MNEIMRAAAHFLLLFLSLPIDLTRRSFLNHHLLLVTATDEGNWINNKNNQQPTADEMASEDAKYTMANFNEFALSRFILSCFLLTMQFLTLRIFACHPEYKFTCFRIMLCIGLCDSSWLFIQGILPLFLFFYNFFADLPWLEKLFGALSESVYVTLYPLNLLLAINRLCVMFKLHILGEFGDGEPVWERRINKVLYVLIALFFVSVVAIFCTPYFGLFFKVDFYVWQNNMNLSLMHLETDIEMDIINNAFPISTIAIYFGIFVMAKVKSQNFIAQGDSSVAARQRANQKRILLQCVVQFVVFQIPAIYFMTGWNPNVSSQQRSGIVKLMMTTICGINPFIYLAMLPNVRQKFWEDYFAWTRRFVHKKQTAAVAAASGGAVRVKAWQQNKPSAIQSSVAPLRSGSFTR